MIVVLDRFETDALLKHRQVTGYSLTDEEIDADAESLGERLVRRIEP